MEQPGDYDQLSDEQRIGLRSVIATFMAHDAFRSQETGGDEPRPSLDLTVLDLMGILPSGHKSEDIYNATRQDFLNAAPSRRTRLTPRKKHLRY